MMMDWPLESMVKLPEPFAIAGRLPPSEIVPLTLKLVVSVPVPSEQSLPVVSKPGLLALLIASRRAEQTVAGSACVAESVDLAAASAEARGQRAERTRVPWEERAPCTLPEKIHRAAGCPEFPS